VCVFMNAIDVCGIPVWYGIELCTHLFVMCTCMCMYVFVCVCMRSCWAVDRLLAFIDVEVGLMVVHTRSSKLKRS